MVAADSLIEAAEGTGNPFVLSVVLATYGTAYGNADPARALDAFRRGLAIAQDGGIRFIESQVSYNLARLENLHTRA